MRFQIDSRRQVAVLTLEGGFMNEREIRSLREAVDKILASGTKRLVVDLEKATHMSSMLLGSLVGFHLSLSRAGGWVVFTNARTPWMTLFHLTKLDRVLKFSDTVDEAISRLESREASPSTR